MTGRLGAGGIERVEHVVQVVTRIHPRRAQVIEKRSIGHGQRGLAADGGDLRSPEEPFLEKGGVLDVDAAEQEQILGDECAFCNRGDIGGAEQRANDEQIEGDGQRDESTEHRGDHSLHANHGTRGRSSARKDLCRGVRLFPDALFHG